MVLLTGKQYWLNYWQDCYIIYIDLWCFYITIIKKYFPSKNFIFLKGRFRVSITLYRHPFHCTCVLLCPHILLMWLFIILFNLTPNFQILVIWSVTTCFLICFLSCFLIYLLIWSVATCFLFILNIYSRWTSVYS